MKHLLAIALVAVLVMAGFIVAMPGARAQRTGAMVDKLVWYEQPNQAQALVDLTSGAMDVYMFPLRTAADIASARANSELKTIDVGGSLNNLFLNPVPVTLTGATPDGTGNPFTHQEIREAMNWVVDRDFISQEIAGGSQFPHITLENRLNPEYGRDAVFASELERQYSFDFDRGRTIIFNTLDADSNYQYDTGRGKWMVKNSAGVYHDLVLNFVIRTEDIRKDIGNYVADQLGKLGFGVNRMILSGGAAFAIVYNGPPETGAWQLYTEGWAATALTAWSDSDPNFFSCGGEGSNIWNMYTPPAELVTVCEDLLNAQYTNLAERQALFEAATRLSLKDGVRVWITAGGTFALSTRVTGLVYDLSGGTWGFLSSRTARFATAGGTMTIGQRLQYLSPWNPWQGFGWLYDALQAYAFTDPAVWPHPHTGLYMPIRATYSVNAPDPTLPPLAVPTDAQIWDSTTSGFKAVASGVTAKSSVTYSFTFGTWHDGETFSMDDVLYELALVYRRACAPDTTGGVCGTAGGDVYAKDDDAATFASILLKDILRGFKVLSPTQLQVWYDYWNVDPTTIAGEINPAFPSTPWTASELALSVIFDDTCRISEVTAANEGRDALDMTKGACRDRMDTNLPTMLSHLPPGLNFDPVDAASRWASLSNFRSTYGHFYASNGPFILTKVDEVAVQTTMDVDPNYPFDADKYDAFLVPRVPQVSFSPAPTVLIGAPAQFVVHTSLQGGGAYDQFSMTWLVIDPANPQNPLFQGSPTKITDGEYAITLTGTQTGGLTPAAYELRTITVGDEAAIPVIVSQSFIAFPDVQNIQQILQAQIDSLKAQLNTARQDQANQTAVSNAQLATLQTLVIGSMALAIIAIIVAVVVVMRAMPRRPKEGMKPPAEEEI